MPFSTTTIDGLIVFGRSVHTDERGFFREVFRLSELEEAIGQRVQFLQVNHSCSTYGVLRGLHAENWEKLIYVPHGEVFTAVADVRPESPTFGCVNTVSFNDANRPTLFLPAGVAHGYCVLSFSADYIYQVSAYYQGTDTCAVAWNDPDLNVPWPTAEPVLSARDRLNPTLRQLFPERYRTRVGA